MLINGHYSLKKHKYGYFFIDPAPSVEQITNFYREEFYSSEYKKFNDSSLEVQLQDREFYEGSWGDVAENIKRLSNSSLEGQSILDVGCGWGLFLEYMSRLGMQCYGFDPAREAVSYASKAGSNVKLAGLDRMSVFDPKRFDVVVLNNVLEHMADPVNIIAEILTDVISPQGIIVIDVPNEFNPFQLAGRDFHKLNEWWVAPPSHLNYFSSDTLVMLLKGEGFKVLHSEASFPLEMFLLFGECYVGNSSLGAEIHKKRVNFEVNLRRFGGSETLRMFYESLAKINIGRQVRVYATPDI